MPIFKNLGFQPPKIEIYFPREGPRTPRSLVGRNRPIVLLGSGLETGHPDQGPALSYNFAMLKTVKLAHLITLSSSPVPCSCENLSFSEGYWIFRLANGCSFFFFESKVVQLAGKPFEGLTVDRLAQRTVCALTDEPRRNQHCKKV